ncbi:MAG: type I-E CRISPR-associated protein Cas7/Cse4/CasC [Microthrixaceae bacterium]
MTRYLNLHILQPFSYANPNRDDTGAPKSALYGGVLRGRISSQSWKRAIRLATEKALDAASWRATPAGLAPKLVDHLVERPEFADADEQTRRAMWVAAWVLVASFTVSNPKTEGAHKAYETDAADDSEPTADAGNREKKDVLAWFTSADLDTLADILAEDWDELAPLAAKKSGGDLTKRLDRNGGKLRQLREHGFGPTDLTVAAFGRMYANAVGASVDAAVQVAHALTTHEMAHQIDYFTAVDDVRNAQRDSQGAGHLGLAQFTGGVYYRYLSINVDDLAANAAALDVAAARALLQAMVLALPSGKQNVTANHEPPLLVLAELRDRSLSYASAFEAPVPVRDAGLGLASARRLVEFAGRVDTMLGGEAERHIVTHLDLDTSDGNGVPDGITKHPTLPGLLDEMAAQWS